MARLGGPRGAPATTGGGRHDHGCDRVPAGPGLGHDRIRGHATHAHLFFELAGEGLKHQWEKSKRWTGHDGAKLPGVEGERFGQDEWFDHWSRSDEEDERIIEYIR